MAHHVPVEVITDRAPALANAIETAPAFRPATAFDELRLAI